MRQLPFSSVCVGCLNMVLLSRRYYEVPSTVESKQAVPKKLVFVLSPQDQAPFKIQKEDDEEKAFIPDLTQEHLKGLKVCLEWGGELGSEHGRRCKFCLLPEKASSTKSPIQFHMQVIKPDVGKLISLIHSVGC